MTRKRYVEIHIEIVNEVYVVTKIIIKTSIRISLATLDGIKY